MSDTLAGQIDLYTYKQGLLSRMAHDLKLTVDRFEATCHDDRVHVVCWADSIRVLGVVRGHEVNPDELSPSDKETIHGNIQEDVLKSRLYPTISFSGLMEGNRLEGTLDLAGQTRPVLCTVASAEGRHRGRVELRPSRWAIKPFKALMGAIRLQDRVVVAFDLGPQE